ncbi:hypothetical protein TMatcc_003437 [Talaromyces marneffei ATCC 18224]
MALESNLMQTETTHDIESGIKRSLWLIKLLAMAGVLVAKRVSSVDSCQGDAFLHATWYPLIRGGAENTDSIVGSSDTIALSLPT